RHRPRAAPPRPPGRARHGAGALPRDPPGVPPRAEVAPGARAAFRARWGLGGRPVVGIFGFLERSKRIALVLDALRELAGSGAADCASAESGARAAERTREAYDAAREARHG